jgi:predicted MPP superfamily phosphohydrolase
MKTITIGDLHGKNCWEQINPDAYDKIIFLGDYVDSFTHETIQIIVNLNKIIKFKKKYPRKVVLLWGNHDIRYFLGQKYGCSGFRAGAYTQLSKIYHDHKDLFNFSYQYKKYLWTHAGIHTGWYKYHFALYDIYHSLEQSLKTEFELRNPSLFMVGWARGGENLVGGPLWLDKKYGWDMPLKGFHQIVGHHPVNKIMTNSIDKDTSITYCDVLDTNPNLFYEKTIIDIT